MKRKREMFWVVMGLFLVLSCAVLHVTFYDRLIKKKYNLSELRARWQETRQELYQLQTEYEALITPQRLAELSRHRLRLTPPKQFEIVALTQQPTTAIRLAQYPEPRNPEP